MLHDSSTGLQFSLNWLCADVCAFAFASFRDFIICDAKCYIFDSKVQVVAWMSRSIRML